ELIVAEDWPAAERRIAALEKGEQDYLTPVELRYRAFDGQTIEAEATAASVAIEGSPAIMSIMRDVTQRKRAERALRESEARLRALFDSAPVGIAIADTDGRYLMVNRAQCEMLGYGEAELLRRTFADVTHPDDVQANLDIAARLWQGEIGAGSVEKRYVRKDGSALWVLLTVSPVRTADGEVLGSVGVAQDITERREAEARRLEYAHRQRDILVREVHHRIKNHLQGLAGLLRQHLREQPALELVVQKFAAQVRAIAIVHGLLGREKGDTSLRSLVDEIAAFLGQMAGSRIEPVCPEHACLLAVAEAEAVPVALVLNELLTNALRHGADPSRLRLSMQCDGNSASVVIRNPGRLSAAVDFAAGKGLGTGLGLIRSLLPPAGAALSLKNTEDGQVEARLELGPPLLLPAQLVSRR
ncbi:MAG: PAS domain S-box protein, partial [Rhodocyclaceae bacterium]|nr:PAS domain S-box protein [Rhodocyclaceae bacterium]